MSNYTDTNEEKAINSYLRRCLKKGAEPDALGEANCRITYLRKRIRGYEDDARSEAWRYSRKCAIQKEGAEMYNTGKPCPPFIHDMSHGIERAIGWKVAEQRSNRLKA